MGENSNLWNFNFWFPHCQGRAWEQMEQPKLMWRSFKASFPKTGHYLIWVEFLDSCLVLKDFHLKGWEGV